MAVRVMPLRPLDRVVAPLPRPLTSLVDRRSELAMIVGLLRDPAVHILTLTGPGGVGKTRLAIAAASDVTAAFPDGVVFVRLASVSDADLVGPTIAHALGLRDMGAESLSGRLAWALGEQRLLMVLDNFEQVVVAAPLLAGLLEVCPHLTMLVTSRVRLRLSGERELPVPPLPVPEPIGQKAGEDAAVALFSERARAVQPDFALTQELASAVVEICRRVDGLPLAIELAAARVKTLPLTALRDRLEQRLPLLTGGGRDLPARQQTMRDTIAWSYDLLSPDEQMLFRRLAVFVGGFTLEAAEAVAGAGEPKHSSLASSPHPPAPAVLDGVASLVEQSLLRQAADAEDEPRYRMLETVREYALERLAASDEEEEVRRCHAGYFLALAEAAEPALLGPEQVRWLARLESDRPNLREALAWATGRDPDVALRLAGALPQFWRLHGHLTEGREALERALATDQGSPAAHAKALLAASLVRFAQGDFEAAVTLAEAVRDRFERLGDRRGVAAALRVVGYGCVEVGHAATPPDQARYARARSALAEYRALCEEMGDRHGVAMAILGFGFLDVNRGDDAPAAALLKEALPLFEEVGDRRGITLTLSNLGRAVARQGDDAGGAAFFTRALAVARELGDRWGTLIVVDDAAWLAAKTGRAETAARLLGAAEVWRQAGGLNFYAAADVASRDPAHAAARAALGEAAFVAAVAAGRSLPFEEAVTEALAVIAAPPAGVPPSEPAAPHGLTPRELDVLRLLVDGASNRAIADALFISPRTATTHVANILAKLDVTTRTEAATRAVRKGLV